jgi:TPP-dependent pyruvate/acetoin dehydrogenase alpha subunit
MLLKKSLISPKEVEGIDRQLSKEIDQAFQFAEKSPFPDPAEISRHLYDEGAS